LENYLLKMTDLDLKHKTVLIREDLNVPIEKGRITSLKRIEAILPTVRAALRQKAKIILISHLGRPQAGEGDPLLSLAPIADCLSNLLQEPVYFIKNKEDLKKIHFGQVCLLENVRFRVGEKENDPALAKELASLCDIFVMDAFATAHRKEASTYGVAEYAPIACAGPLLMAEINALQKVMNTPSHPLIAIVGGSKVSTKLLVLKNLLSKADALIVGGGIANTFLVAQGFKVGHSLYEKELLPVANELLSFAKANNKQILLPVDVVVAKRFEPEAKAIVKPIEDIEDELIVDIGPKTRQKLVSLVRQAKTVLWSGPMGVFEWEPFAEGTKALAKAIADNSQAYTVAGGGDTLAAIEKYQIDDKISYISTGGGAFLTFLEGKQLPAIAILEEQSKKSKGKL
jgi:phosphoglycerate kinase